MCGIVTIIGRDGTDAREAAIRRYRAQDRRGREGFGFVAVRGGRVVGYERAETEAEIMAALGKVPCDTILFHHRFPTSTPNLSECAHPIRVSHDDLRHDYYLIHNGVIWDEESKRLHDRHVSEGWRYSTQIDFVGRVGGREIPINSKWNDSEALAIELARDIDKGGDGVDIEGSVAFAMLQADKEGNVVSIFWGTNGQNPLKVGESGGVIAAVCSEGGEEADKDVLFRLDYATGELDETPYVIGSRHGRGLDDVIVPADMDISDYYGLMEEADDLRHRRRILAHARRDTEDIDASIEAIECDIGRMEARSPAGAAN